jgi:hypothetical protein
MLTKPDLHIRLSPEAKAALHLLAEVEQLPISVLAARYLEETILGRSHVLTVAARRLGCRGISGSDGDE